MNVLLDKWLPVVRRDGAREFIAPWEITSNYEENPVAYVDSGRADLDQGAILFVISLLQTAFLDIDELDWDEMYDDPPSPNDLKGRLNKLAPYFEVMGDVSFMQDFDRLENIAHEPIDRLLAGYPGQSGLESRTDHFIKRSAYLGVCERCLPLVLFSAQSAMPAGGAGYQVSIRKNSPVLCLVAPIDIVNETLWETAWLNVVPGDDFNDYVGGVLPNEPINSFPWLSPTITSDKCGDEKVGDLTGTVTPETASSLVALWCQPGRIRVVNEKTAGCCSACGEQSEVFKSMRRTNHGPKYRNWRHPLSPTFINKNNIIEHVTVRNESFTYRDWPVFALPGVAKDDKDQRRASLNVEVFLRDRRISRCGLRVYGISNRQADLNRVDEAQLDVLPVNTDGAEIIKMHALRMTRVAEEIGSELKTRLYKVWRREDAGDQKRKFPFHQKFFWKETESLFRSAIAKLAENEDASEVVAKWFSALRRKALDIFDRYTLDAEPLGSSRLGKIMEARRFYTINMCSAQKYKMLGITKKERDADEIEPKDAVVPSV